MFKNNILSVTDGTSSFRNAFFWWFFKSEIKCNLKEFGAIL